LRERTGYLELYGWVGHREWERGAVWAIRSGLKPAKDEPVN